MGEFLGDEERGRSVEEFLAFTPWRDNGRDLMEATRLGRISDLAAGLFAMTMYGGGGYER
jgi:hypothetical protein